MFAIAVTIHLLPGTEHDFLRLMKINAEASLREEPGCHQFDIATDPARPHEVFLYELYTDEAAFGDHLTTAHFARFDAAATPMIARKDVKTYRQVTQ